MTQRGKIKRIRMTEKDTKALAWACEHGALTLHQFWQAVWHFEKSKSSAYAYDRISSMAKLGYLEPLKDYTTGRSVFRITRLGYDLVSTLVAKSPLLSKEHPTLPPSLISVLEIPHALTLIDLRLHLRRVGKIQSWVTDRCLMVSPEFMRSRLKTTIPDAIWVTQKGKKVAVEFERSTKANERLRAKIRAYDLELAREDRLIDLVLWIANGLAYNALQKALNIDSRTQVLRRYQEFIDSTSVSILAPFKEPALNSQIST